MLISDHPSMQWTGSHPLSRSVSGFEGTVQVPWGRKLSYKYIVDGRWTTTDDQPTELDSIGNLNNVYNVPARPPTPKVIPAPAAPELVSQPQEPSQPAGVINGILSTARNAAVAMVEAIAPGTTEAAQPTPAVTSDSIRDPIEDAATQVKENVVEPATETAAQVKENIVESVTETATQVKDSVVEPTTEAATHIEESVIEPAGEAVKSAAEDTQSKVLEAVAPAPEPVHTPTQEDIPTPKEEITAEAVLPVAVEEAETAPIVPVPVLPLTAAADASATDGKVEKPLETNIVEGSATGETVVDPVEHVAPVSETADAPNGSSVQPSTHTPVVNGSASTAPEEHAKDAPATNGVAATEAPSTTVPVNGVNGNGTHEKPVDIPLPLPTPSEVPLPPTPAVNGRPSVNGHPSETPSGASSPASSPRKEKRFPTFGRHHRQSSSGSVATSSGTPDEHGVLESPSRKGTHKKKRTSSIFGKIKHLFGDEHKKEKEAA